MHKQKKTYIISFLILLGAMTGCIFFSKKSTPQPEITEKIYAEILLRNLAEGMRIASTTTGGGGQKNFPNSSEQLKSFIMPEASSALDGIPFHGYIIELQEYPVGDAFKTNFRFEAKPAPGFQGESFFIDKTEVIKNVQQ